MGEKEKFLITEQAGLDVRTKNFLENGGISYLTDIKSVTQLRRIRGIGPEAITEILSCIENNQLPAPPEVDFISLPPSRFKKKMALEIAMEVLAEHSKQEGFKERDICAIKQLEEILDKMR